MKKITLFLVSLLFAGALWAQNVQVSGVVTDTDGHPVIGASVVVKGTGVHATTDVNGKYTIATPANAVLSFTMMGMQAQDVQVSGRTLIDVTLSTDAVALEEVLVVGYGTTRKTSYTGSISVAKSDDIMKRTTSSVTSTLQGLSAGVKVVANSGQPGENATIRIRGIGSLNASASPLWVVDGAPYDGGLLNALNPNDIESITILEDAAAASIYGARAANGVIMVTTKKGTRNAAPTITFEAKLGVNSRAVKEYSKVNAKEYLRYQWEAYKNLRGATWATNNLITNTVYNPVFVNGVQMPKPIDTDGNYVEGATFAWDQNWFDVLTQTPIRQEYLLSVGGGSQNSRYYIALGYLKDQGLAITSEFNRYSLRLSADSDITKWLSIGTTIAGAMTSQNYPSSSGSAYNNVYNWTRLVAPIYPVYQYDNSGNIVRDEKGNPVYDLGYSKADHPSYASATTNPYIPKDRPVAAGQNPVASTELNTIDYRRNSVSPSMFANVSFTDWLKFRVQGNLNYWSSTDDQIYSKQYGDAFGMGRIYKTRRQTIDYTINEVLEFSKTFGEVHNVKALVGHENSFYQYKYLYGHKTTTFSDELSELSTASVTADLTSYTSELAREGYFGRASYDYDNKYFVEGSLRTDASSRFADGHRWGTFWAASAGWLLSGESFIQELEWLNLLKLRASYGTQGNDNLLNADGGSMYYASQGLFNLGYNYLGIPGILMYSNANNKLTWETNKTLNIGLDFALLENRLSGSLQFYNRVTDNMLFALPLPNSTGIKPNSSGESSINSNAGSMVNRGVDIKLQSVVYKNDHWNIGLNATFGYLHNEITELPQEEIINGTKKWMVGRNAYEYWIRDWAGVNPANGDPLWWKDTKDAEGNVIGRETTSTYSEASLYYKGTALPKYEASVSTPVSFYNFDFYTMWTGSFGHKILDYSYATMLHMGERPGYIWHTDIAKRWTPENRNAVMPAISGTSSSANAAATTRFMYSGNNVRLRSVVLGYTFPKVWMDKVHVKKLRIYVQLDNILTFRAPGLPDGLDTDTPLSGIQDVNSTPYKTITGGISITF